MVYSSVIFVLAWSAILLVSTLLPPTSCRQIIFARRRECGPKSGSRSLRRPPPSLGPHGPKKAGAKAAIQPSYSEAPSAEQFYEEKYPPTADILAQQIGRSTGILCCSSLQSPGKLPRCLSISWSHSLICWAKVRSETSAPPHRFRALVRRNGNIVLPTCWPNCGRAIQRGQSGSRRSGRSGRLATCCSQTGTVICG